jgi:hypothetical protein
MPHPKITFPVHKAVIQMPEAYEAYRRSIIVGECISRAAGEVFNWKTILLWLALAVGLLGIIAMCEAYGII